MDIEDIAEQVFAALDTGRQIAPFSTANPDFSLDEAYRVSSGPREREARGNARSAVRSASPQFPCIPPCRGKP